MRLQNVGVTSPLEALDRIQRALDEVRALAERKRSRPVDRSNKQPAYSEASFVDRYAVALSKSRDQSKDDFVDDRSCQEHSAADASQTRLELP